MKVAWTGWLVLLVSLGGAEPISPRVAEVREGGARPGLEGDLEDQRTDHSPATWSRMTLREGAARGPAEGVRPPPHVLAGVEVTALTLGETTETSFGKAVFLPGTNFTKPLLPCASLLLCSKRALNKGYSASLSPNLMDSKTLDQTKGCFCDEACKTNGDCCLDHAVDTTAAKRHWDCITYNTKWGRYGAKGCADSKWSALCSRAERPDISVEVPVFSASKAVLYANIYCAVCHRDLDVLRPNFTLRCNSDNVTMGELKYLEGSWRTERGTVCAVEVDDAPWRRRTRPCVSAQDSCPHPAPGHLSAACASYSQLVASTVLYKNPHCALCNGENLSSLFCWRGFIERRTKVSMTVILNFEWDFNSCLLPNNVWDPVAQRCERLVCHLGNCTIQTQCPPESCPTTQRLTLENYLTIVSLSVSICCLLLHNLFYYTATKRRTLPSEVLKSLAWSLILGQTLFLSGVDPLIPLPNPVCVLVAASTHYFVLAGFFWMNVMSLDVCRTFSKLELRNSYSFYKYSVYAWGTPFCVVTLAIISELLQFPVRPFYASVSNRQVCWFFNRLGLGLFLYLPVTALLLANLFLFTKTVLWFQKQTNDHHVLTASGRKDYQRLWLYLKLSIIMGLSWLFSSLGSLTRINLFTYFFIVLNGLQGTFIFFMFDLKQQLVDKLFSRRKGNTSDGLKKLRTSTSNTHLSHNFASSGKTRRSSSRTET